MESIEAINLRSFDYRDSSLILIVFSMEYGRVSLIARGAKKSSKSSKGLLQSFCHNQYIVGRKTNLSIISSVDSIDTFSELSTDSFAILIRLILGSDTGSFKGASVDCVSSVNVIILWLLLV